MQSHRKFIFRPMLVQISSFLQDPIKNKKEFFTAKVYVASHVEIDGKTGRPASPCLPVYIKVHRY